MVVHPSTWRLSGVETSGYVAGDVRYSSKIIWDNTGAGGRGPVRCGGR
jgi:hypothetical protein